MNWIKLQIESRSGFSKTNPQPPSKMTSSPPPPNTSKK